MFTTNIYKTAINDNIFIPRNGEKFIMQYSKETYDVAYSIVSNHAKFSKLDASYILNVSDIPEIILCLLASKIMQDNPGLESESIGPDNPSFHPNMFPSLINYLENINNKNWQSEFLNTWRKGILSYQKESILELLEDALEEFNHVNLSQYQKILSSNQ
jgi:hypothetical protein